jgi:hypothetical protein
MLIYFNALNSKLLYGFVLSLSLEFILLIVIFELPMLLIFESALTLMIDFAD